MKNFGWVTVVFFILFLFHIPHASFANDLTVVDYFRLIQEKAFGDKRFNFTFQKGKWMIDAIDCVVAPENDYISIYIPGTGAAEVIEELAVWRDAEGKAIVGTNFRQWLWLEVLESRLVFYAKSGEGFIDITKKVLPELTPHSFLDKDAKIKIPGEWEYHPAIVYTLPRYGTTIEAVLNIESIKEFCKSENANPKKTALYKDFMRHIARDKIELAWDPKKGVFAENPSWGYVSTLKLNFRTTPEGNGKKVKGRETLYLNMEFAILDRLDKWVRVRLNSGIEGWLLTEWEKEVYVKTTDSLDKNVQSHIDPIDSNAFLTMADRDALKWDKKAGLYFLCGYGGGLDGCCVSWTALYRAGDKPGKKFIAARQDAWTFGDREYAAEEWNADWRSSNGLTGRSGSSLWHHLLRYVAGKPSLSTAELTSLKNMNAICDIDAKRDDIDLAATAGPRGFTYLLDGPRWIIATPRLDDYTLSGYLAFKFSPSGGFQSVEAIKPETIEDLERIGY